MFLFISDIHVDSSPNEHHLPIKLKEICSKYEISAVFFLGDVFEFWWGDDHNDTVHSQWEAWLKDLKFDKYLICGNRDFLLGDDFFQKTGITKLSPGCMLDIANKKIALYHGDEEALLDEKYHFFRRIVRSSLLQTLWSLLPHTWRKSISTKGRTYSNPPASLLYNYDLWIKQLPDNLTHIIHGHCHKQETSVFKTINIITLGHWYNNEYSIFSIDKNGQEKFL